MPGLSATPLGPSTGVNWVFLVETLVAGILAVFFLFYFNRLFATLVSYGVRAWTWHKYRAYIDITALQISLLGGRIFFKGIRYHAHNVTVLVHDGHITWRYWLRQVQEAEIFETEEENTRKGKQRTSSSAEKSDDDSKDGGEEKPRSSSVGRAEKGGTKAKKEKPCRISVKVSAVEAFIYNRSPAYDMLVDAALRTSESPPSSSEGDEKSTAAPPLGSSDRRNDKQGTRFGVTPEKTGTNDTNGAWSTGTGTSHSRHPKPKAPSWLQLLPVRIECKRAAGAVGNEHTTSIITAKMEKAVGTVDAAAAGPLDLFKLLFNFDFEKVHVAMKPNRDFKQLQLDYAQRVLRDRENAPPPSKRWSFAPAFKLRRNYDRLAAQARRPKSANGSLRARSLDSGGVEKPATTAQDQVPGLTQWHGLARYLVDTDLDEHVEWQNVEYAKASTLVECDKISFRFYFDIPGKVPDGTMGNEPLLGSADEEDINGSSPPEYGLDFGVHGGNVVYGPWADRQRVNLQQIFFPASCVNATPATPLKPGDTRAWTTFKIYVSVEEDVTLRVPTREPSKDDQWVGRAGNTTLDPEQSNLPGKTKGKHGRKQKHKRHKGKQGAPPTDARPYAWLDVTVKKDSTVNYVMDMYARSTGFQNHLDLDVKGTEMTSSVNHGLLWRAGPLTLDADLSYPLAWNTLRKWPFKIVCDDLELFILRDHMFLITDIVNDWSSGPPPEFYTFVSFYYDMDLRFRNFTMYLNVNDANIINDPADLDKNDFLTLEGSDLHSVLGIPLEFYRPKRNEITFEVLAQDMKMRVLSPLRSTFGAFLHEKQVADLPKLTLKGSFDQNGESMPGLTDVLRFDIVGSGLNLKAYGFVVRQLVNIKENYFGDYVHFKTLEEFQDAGDKIDEANAETASTPHPSVANELDVILCIIAKDATVMVPTNMYSGEEFIRVELPVANLDLRIVSYYLDMGLNLAPLSLLSGATVTDPDDSPIENASSTQIYCSHVDLSGHRAFGSPPTEPAYISTWDIDVGRLTGECSGAFLHNLALAAKCFIFTFQDGENALPLLSPSIFHDVTFVQVHTDIVRLWLHVGRDALLLASQPISVSTNDWAGDRSSQCVTVLAPQITFACVDGRSASRHRVRRTRRAPVKTHAFLQTGVVVNVVGRKMHFADEKRAQQHHIRECDRRTHRAPFLQHRTPGSPDAGVRKPAPQPPAMPYPGFPFPVDSAGRRMRRPSSIQSVTSYLGDKSLHRKVSDSSLMSSVRAAGQSFEPLSRPGGARSLLSSQSTESNSKSSASGSIRLRSDRMPSDREKEQFRLPPSTMAFSSQFSEPYFPLDMVEPDQSNVPPLPDLTESDDAASESANTGYPKIDDEAEHTAVFIRVVPGIRAYVEPRVGATAAKLLQMLMPKNVEDVMDDFQVNVMSSITSQQKQRKGSNTVLEIQLDLPSAHVRVVHPSERDVAGSQFDLVVQSLRQMVRVRDYPSSGGLKEVLALHTAVDALDLSLGERNGGANSPAAIRATVDGVMVWVGMASTQSVHVSVRDTNLSAAGDQVNALIQMALTLTPIAEEMKTRFGDPYETERKRLMLLMYTLTQHGESLGDPPFLSRMTYILRAFPDHYRNQESWKIIARFRFILQSLPTEVRQDLNDKFKAGDVDCPADTPSKVLESWAQWRNWDVPDVHRSVAFRELFGQMEELALDRAEISPLALTVRSERLKVAVEHGSKASQIVLEETSIVLNSIPPTVPTGLMLVDENKRTRTTTQINTRSIGFTLEWGMYGVVEGVLPHIPGLQHLASSNEAGHNRSTSRALEEGLNRHDFHLVFSTDDGSITLQTINLRQIVRAEGLKMSLIGTTQAGERFRFDQQWGQCVSATINADRAITELHGPTSRVWRTFLVSPSLYIDHLQPVEDHGGSPSVTLAVAYKDLQLTVEEQVPGILHIVDSVIVDEVSKILHLVETVSADIHEESNTQQVVSRPQQTPKISIAVLAGRLHLEISLLQSLSYRLKGSAASVRVAPSLSKTGAWNIDFDVGQQSHSFVNLTGDERHHQGIFHLPPINGHVGLATSSEATHISAATTIEKIEIDAAAIPGVMGVINKPEVQDVFSAIKVAVRDLRSRVSDLAPGTTQPSKKAFAQDQRITFDVRFALLGVRVSASTPQTRDRATAGFEFGIGPLHATATNEAAINDAVSLIPEVRVQVQDIGARLWINERDRQHQCGNVTLGIKMHFSSYTQDSGRVVRQLMLRSEGLEVNAFPETASTVIDVINHLQDRIRDLDLSKEVEYLRKLRDSRREEVIQNISGKQKASDEEGVSFSAADLLSVQTTIDLSNIRVSWLIAEQFASGKNKPEDAVLTLSSIQLTTRGGDEARLTIRDLMLELVPQRDKRGKRALNSALLPEIGFSVAYWSHDKTRSLAVKATGKPLDLRLESKFIVPVTAVQRSVEFATEKFKTGTATWQSTPTSTGAPRAQMFDTTRLASLLIEADFAGAQVYMQGSGASDKTLGGLAAAASQQEHRSPRGGYGQTAADEGLIHTTLTAPGIALKLEYNKTEHRPTVNGELRIDASSNILLPTVVPLLLEVSDSVKNVVQSQGDEGPLKPQTDSKPTKPAQKFFDDESLMTANPTAIFGKTKVDLGLRICRQEFGLTCQPIARVDAKAALDDFYFTINTIESDEYGHFFAMSATVTKLTATVKHVYSREPTFSYDMDSIVLSLMNSKHVSGTSGVSAVIKISPTHLSINGKQLQDLLLFREIWLPPEIRSAQTQAAPASSTRPEDLFAQRYHTVAAAAAFPWNATVSIAELGVDLDLGQSIGKTSFTMTNLWASQQKSSSWEQNLCVGLEQMAMTSTGRMSGFVQLGGLGVRTSIKWPEESGSQRVTPQIQASAGFGTLRTKAAFDYQAFAYGDIEDFDFLMYNVQETGRSSRHSDRLVAVMDCEKAFVFCTSTSPAQAVGLYQAFDRLIQEKQAAYNQSLKDIEKHLRRASTTVPAHVRTQAPQVRTSQVASVPENKSPISLHTDVVLTLGVVSFGVYPSTFLDSQILKLEANNIQGRFAVGLEKGKIHSGLGMTLGQLQVALASVKRMTAVPKALEVSVDEIINSATNAKGGIILRVPKVIASMQTWQAPHDNQVDYIFKSLFQGKIDVGWNLSRINFIQGMYTAHTRSLASRLGKALPQSAVRITAGMQEEGGGGGGEKVVDGRHEKITAEVNLPQSRYEYRALEPPVIETPQLRDMGEATPPLEWIGLNRDRLPNVTHQIIIVSLLEVAKEVEDAYERILGSS